MYSIPDFSKIPESIRHKPEEAWKQLFGSHEKTTPPNLPENILESLPKVWASSHFVVEQCLRHQELILRLTQSGRLTRAYDADEYRQLVINALQETTDEVALMVALRRFRNEEMVRIAWRDISGWSNLDETLEDLSSLAEACVQSALDRLFDLACAQKGTPLNQKGLPQNLVVLAMGKLGAKELNFSSDIDLIFAYRDEGVLADKKETTYGEFYTRLSQKLVKVLDSNTEDGFVFRVDTRLRPFGESGPLVMNFNALESYYQSQAREWERYAMVKVRTIAGDINAGHDLEGFLQPYVYRRYLDYRTLSELREIKLKISQELQRKDRQENIKLGPGGIREIEFIGQAFQLIRGGPERRLRERRIQVVIGLIAELSLMDPKSCDQLIHAYRYLRTLENRLQQYSDRQTHDIPKEENVRSAVAYSLGYSNWEALEIELCKVRQEVHSIFQEVITGDSSNDQPFPALNLSSDQIRLCLVELGWSEPDELVSVISSFLSSSKIRALTTRGSAELRRLLPKVFVELLNEETPSTTLERVLSLLEAIATRNVYITLLCENPIARRQLIKLASASPWICKYIAQHPLLLDELLDHRSLFSLGSKTDLQTELSRRLSIDNFNDLEDQLILLCEFKQSQVLRVAASDLFGYIRISEVSDHLSFIAEALVDKALELSWRDIVNRYGCLEKGSERIPKGFAIIAYGKLGGYELGYGSDLDLVFLYSTDDTRMSNGAKSICASEYFGRLGRKLIQYLTTPTTSGRLYETDLRLRPSGESGLLVNSLNAFEVYQMHQSWTWEQQALVKARYIAGDPKVAERFEVIRKNSLCRERPYATLLNEVVAMRKKMSEHHSQKDPRLFNLKHDEGGIVDIEFLVQFGVLSCAHRSVNLSVWTDVFRILGALVTAGFITQEEADRLREAYYVFREASHREALQEKKPIVTAEEFSPHRLAVQKVWQRIFNT